MKKCKCRLSDEEKKKLDEKIKKKVDYFTPAKASSCDPYSQGDGGTAGPQCSPSNACTDTAFACDL